MSEQTTTQGTTLWTVACGLCFVALFYGAGAWMVVKFVKWCWGS